LHFVSLRAQRTQRILDAVKPHPVARVLLALLAAGLPAAAALDWPQWRGPSRDGRAPGFQAPAEWPASLTLGWKATVGTGHSSPVVSDGRVFVHAREGDDEVLSSFDLAAGRRLWREAYAAPYTMHPAATGHGKGPKATPVVSGGRVYAFGVSGILSCWDAGTGRPVWRKDFADRFRQTSPIYGAAMSPLVADGLVVANVGGEGNGALAAFDAATGAERWAWTGDGPGYASPVVADLGGVRQVITQTQRHVVSLSLAKGELLWRIPFATAYDQNAVTPVVAGARVVYSGLDGGVRAVEPARKGGSWAAEEVWRNEEVSAYLSTPVAESGVLYGLSHRRKGQVFALDLASGRTLWTSEGRTAENAALVAAGGVLLILTDGAELIVARPDRSRFVPVRTYTVADSATWAHPVPTDQGILVKDVDSLALWRLQ
jgi:outer membrane protein assembly factor BamB